MDRDLKNLWLRQLKDIIAIKRYNFYFFIFYFPFQVIRRYREETADGSIVWGFENDDGSFKEEIIGKDCITRGKYGYVDPDGVRREYTYETGIKCNEEQQQQDQDILNTFVDYQENKLVLPSGKTIDLSGMGKKQARRPQLYRN